MTDMRLLLEFFFGIILLYKFLPIEQSSKRFEDLALGKETTTTYGKVSDLRVHCSDLSDLIKCLQSYEKIVPKIQTFRFSAALADILTVALMTALVIVFLRPINQFIYFQF